MKKLLNISVIAALAILPLAANAAVTVSVDKDPGETNANAPVATNPPKYSLATASEADETNVATASYVKGAYNAAIKAINNVAGMATNATNSANISYDKTESGLAAGTVQGAIDELASEKANKATTLAGYNIADAYTKEQVDSAITNGAVQTVVKGGGNGTIRVDGGADVTIYDDTALANRVSANETHIGTLSGLQTTEKDSLVGAINEVKGTAGFAGTAAELSDSHFDPTDTTSAAKAANAAMAAAAAAQADVDAVETDLSTNYATKTGVENAIKTATITATVPTVKEWGTETAGTASVTVSSIAATYPASPAEPAEPAGN